MLQGLARGAAVIELYHNDMSVCAQKVRLALEELELEWTSHHLKLRGTEQLTPAYLAVNPKGQVPALVDDDFIVVESTVINEYLADAHGRGALVPSDARGRARMRWWTRQLDEDIHASVGTMSQAISFRHQYLATGEDNLTRILSAIPDEARREFKRTAFKTGLDNPGLPLSVRRTNKLLADMDASLADSEWLAGNKISLADVGLIPYVVRVEQLAMSMMLDGRRHLHEWLDRMRRRPSYKRAMEDWFNPDYLALSAATGKEAFSLVTRMIHACAAT
jgi:glutathione S-transferase